MFRHKGKHRTFRQNIKLASLLSFVAGIVNVAGYFSLSTLTTNVTGHFAFFADELVKSGWQVAQVSLFYIASFFAGALISGIAVEYMLQRMERYMYVIPVVLEMLILTAIAFCGPGTLANYSILIAGSMLFAMGMQNALVTSISNSIVRTTHLTGLFTDLGIETGQLIFYRKPEQRKKLKSSIMLRLAIISFFFLGCLAGGYGYFIFGISILLLAVVSLGGGLVYDNLRYRVTTIKRKYMK
jgi:uncharacterized membrane protein YoaK (UPF0700 family)